MHHKKSIEIRLRESVEEENIQPEEGPRKASLLLESDIVKSGSKAEVILIEAGWSLNSRYYSEQVLRQAMPLFERAPISVYGFGSEATHLDQGYRDFTPGFTSNIAGWAVNVREGKGEHGRFAIVADFEVARQDVRDLLLTADKLAEGGKYPLGLSIDAQGSARRGLAEGRTGLIVDAIEHVFEVTLVDRPAAGGKILRLTAFLLYFSGRRGIKLNKVSGMQESELVAHTIKLLQELDGDKSLINLAIKFLKDGKL